jgi:hypothetical protein
LEEVRFDSAGKEIDMDAQRAGMAKIRLSQEEIRKIRPKQGPPPSVRRTTAVARSPQLADCRNFLTERALTFSEKGKNLSQGAFGFDGTRPAPVSASVVGDETGL